MFALLIIDDVIIKGAKDGVHLGRGKRFTIRNGVFKTFDDAIALNAHDYAASNPELGWIEDGVIENCYDLDEPNTMGYFCRILAGAWIDWKTGIEVQNSDTVVSNGKLYRVKGQPDGTKYISKTQPMDSKGNVELEGIKWEMIQDDVTYTAGVKNVQFKDIFLYKSRIGFSVHFYNDKYSRLYYPGATIPKQEKLFLNNIRVLYDTPKPLFSIGTPINVITLSNSDISNNNLLFYSNKAMTDYLTTHINIYGTVFNTMNEYEILKNNIPNKTILFKTTANIVPNEDFKASITNNGGKITVHSDLPGLIQSFPRI